MTSKNDHNQFKEQKDKLNSYARFSGLAIQMFAIIGIGTFIGVKLDEWYPNDSNWFTIGLALFSVLGAIFYVIKRIIAGSKEI